MHERHWEWELKLGDIRQFKDQLNEFLESYTKDLAKGIVDACGELNALDAWRLLAERGHSFDAQPRQRADEEAPLAA